jgi:hypothetical protein
MQKLICHMCIKCNVVRFSADAVLVQKLLWIVFFFALMQKRNKKNQGCRKMAKNYFVNRARRELASDLRDVLNMPRAQTTLRASR